VAEKKHVSRFYVSIAGKMNEFFIDQFLAFSVERPFSQTGGVAPLG
jgi:hypothetical protein